MSRAMTKVVRAVGAGVLLSVAVGAQVERPVSLEQQQVDGLASVSLVTLPRQDNAALVAAARALDQQPFATPYRFAEGVAVALSPATAGRWDELTDGSRLWRLRIQSPEAVHLNVGFSRFDPPAGARVWLYNRATDQVLGPYDRTAQAPDGQLWTAIVFGDEVVVELHLPAGTGGSLDGEDAGIEIGQISHGFRLFQEKQGSCNNDVVCPEGDAWRDQIRSVARYTVNGTTLCTGELLNNTGEDGRPYFLTAFHCGVNASSASSLVVYWNFESPTCGQLSGGSLSENQSGAIFRAGYDMSDTTLVELLDPPDPLFNVFYSGWDVTGSDPSSSVAIHHPSGDEKAISFDNDPATTVSVVGFDPAAHFRIGQWEDGTTEPGSSGSCIFNPEKRCVGTLTGGFASCTVIDADFYGKLSVAWNGGGTPDTRLRDWLDPFNSGTQVLDGTGDPGPGGTCTPSSTRLCFHQRRFAVEATWRNFSGKVGNGKVMPVSSDVTGLFYFFSDNNGELLVKVLRGCDFNNHFWVFAAGATNVEYTLTVTDTLTDTPKVYKNELGTPAAPILDTTAFATCP